MELVAALISFFPEFFDTKTLIGMCSTGGLVGIGIGVYKYIPSKIRLRITIKDIDKKIIKLETLINERSAELEAEIDQKVSKKELEQQWKKVQTEILIFKEDFANIKRSLNFLIQKHGGVLDDLL